ncbi:MAG: NAD-dependent epimerase/dehydratase family protein [Pseudomonadales bacterium]
MTSKSTGIALSGARGYVGQFVRDHLLAQGERVRALTHTARARAAPSPELQWLEGNLALQDGRPALCDALLEGQRALVHCAFAHVPGRYRGGEGADPEQFWAANLLPTIALLEAARRQGLERVVLMSSRAVMDGYAEHPIEIGDDQPPRPTTHYGALKAAEEALADHYSRSSSLCVSCLRLTGVYGVAEPTERSKWLGLIAEALASASAPISRSGSEVHGQDVASAVALLLEQPLQTVRGRTFNCSDIVVSHTQILREAQRYTSTVLPVPDESPSPNVLLTCAGLTELGWQPGGRGLFEQTVQALVVLAQGSKPAA